MTDKRKPTVDKTAGAGEVGSGYETASLQGDYTTRAQDPSSAGVPLCGTFEVAELADAGLSVIPILADGSKKPPIAWAEFTGRRATGAEIRDWQRQGYHLAVVSGPISGNAELMDFDDPPLFPIWCEIVEALQPGLIARLCTIRTRRGGAHVRYRCSAIEGNQKLAIAKTPRPGHDGTTLIETRGARLDDAGKWHCGYGLIPPSDGYTLLQGDLRALPTITAEERTVMFAAARSLTEAAEQSEPERRATRTHNGELRPGDDFNEHGDALGILTAHGWSILFWRGDTAYLERKDKPERGVSATWNYIPRKLYVFSTNAAPFDADRTYSPFAIKALLEHNGDFRATAGALRGEQQTTTGAHLDQAASCEAVDVLDCLSRGETGDADLLTTLYRGGIIYDHTEGAWHVWTRHVWTRDKTFCVYRLVSDAVAARYLAVAADARQAGNTDRCDALLDRARALRNRRRVENVLFLAARPNLGIVGDQWDRDPWLLGCANGVIDLRTGELRPGRPEDYMRCASPVEWRGLDTQCPQWDTFLQQVFQKTPDIPPYLQRLFGYGITGLTWEAVFPILWGDNGRNGKGTLLETVGAVLGNDLALSTKADSLMDSGRSNGNAPQPFVYEMRGKRIVWASETKDGRKIDAALLKLLTGGDTLNVRTLHGKPVSFPPTHLVLLITNHRPHIPADDPATWFRVNLIPFVERFVPEPTKGEHLSDPALKDKLLAEAPGILAWLVRGCLEWQKHGLKPPDTVKAATEEYRKDEDTLALFLKECCTIGDGHKARAGELYRTYAEWAKRYGIEPVTLSAFGRQMKKRFEHEETNVTTYKGVGVNLF